MERCSLCEVLWPCDSVEKTPVVSVLDQLVERFSDLVVLLAIPVRDQTHHVILVLVRNRGR